MNDRFKFRAWDKITQKIYSVAEIGYNNSKIDYMQLEIPDLDFNITGLSNRFVLMQCTGLKDKNGKLIFEGDVLQDGVGNIFEVSFIKYCYFVHEIKRHHWMKLDEGHTSYEIIGNIYENPELLET